MGRPRLLPDAKPRACAHCGTVFTPIRKRPQAKYCGASCSGKAMCTQEHNAKVAKETALKRRLMQLGRGEGKSYRKHYGRHEHRVVMEYVIGRALKPKEIVHHIDGNRLNNHPSNLQLLPNQSEHARLHSTKHIACTIPECNKPHKSNGMCGMHQTREYRTKKLGASVRGITGLTTNRNKEIV